MTYFFENSIVEEYGNHKTWTKGCYITPDGKIFDVDEYAQTAHENGFVIPYFNSFMHPEDEEEFRHYTKEELLQTLISWENMLCKKEFDVNKKEQQMRLALTRYLINMYRSSRSTFDRTAQIVDFSDVTGIPNGDENLYGRDRFIKDISVQACNYDAIESMLERGITTSKFNINEVFYDYILNDYKIYQIPKKIYDFKEERFIDYKQEEWMRSDKEKRLEEELHSICNRYPLEERNQFCRCKVKVNLYDF